MTLPPSPTNTPRSDSSSRALASVLEYVELFLICLGAILLVFSFFFSVCNVDGDSMLPTLENGQLLIVSDRFYTPEQGDIVVFHQTGNMNKPVIKRVIATEGQHVRIDYTAKTVSVDGQVLEEDYIQLIHPNGAYRIIWDHHVSTESGHAVFEATVPKGSLFVMGDNRNNSKDSRSLEIGFVDERRVLGRVLLRLTPFSAFGTVD